MTNTPAKKTVPSADEASKKKEDIHYSDGVTALKVNKTPNELAQETPDETIERYGVNTEVSEEDLKDPQVQVYKDTVLTQIPSGTHLHPDVARDLQNRGISQHTTDSAQVHRQIMETRDFAGNAEQNDKFVDTRDNSDDKTDEKK